MRAWRSMPARTPARAHAALRSTQRTLPHPPRLLTPPLLPAATPPSSPPATKRAAAHAAAWVSFGSCLVTPTPRDTLRCKSWACSGGRGLRDGRGWWCVTQSHSQRRARASGVRWGASVAVWRSGEGEARLAGGKRKQCCSGAVTHTRGRSDYCGGVKQGGGSVARCGAVYRRARGGPCPIVVVIAQHVGGLRLCAPRRRRLNAF